MISSVGVIGAGVMGQGIAQVFATAGAQTMIYDISSVATERCVAGIGNQLSAAVEKGKMTALRRDEILSRIFITAGLEELRAQLVIEAAAEDLNVKQMLLRSAEAANDSDTLLATNTSSISIKTIAGALKNPSHFLGVHFFNPAPVMKLVEIVATTETDKLAVRRITEFLTGAGKVCVEAADTPGFIVNRVARHFYLESLSALEQGVVDVAGADALLRSAGFRMGPFELMDLIGIDINYAVSKSVYEAFGNAARFKPNKLQEEKVKAGTLGKKTGGGFYPG